VLVARLRDGYAGERRALLYSDLVKDFTRALLDLVLDISLTALRIIWNSVGRIGCRLLLVRQQHFQHNNRQSFPPRIPCDQGFS
jgi:hypothetical protein